ncbi:E3 ubiquitin-protein ligase NEURL3 [Chaetodon auriga]|uniref:E3 ubiquitin-protein ligase NEURL3 n=1 Tax=Chaetodon auriga TaxID=39042 RepID=UPI0040330290
MTTEPRSRREHILPQDTKKRAVCVFSMEKESDHRDSVTESERPHKCGLSCLGPLTFHPQAVGDKVCLSQGCRLAERKEVTFKNGLVFSSRPVKINERIRLRVEKDTYRWHGALRVGFTNVPPSSTSLPLPAMAIPNLTERHGYWASPVHETYCQAGSQLEFWVSYGGSIYITSSNTGPRKILEGVDLSRPLWAMIDIYGQTRSIYLLGSEKRGVFYTRRSCPARERLTSTDVENLCSLIPDGDSDESTSSLSMEEDNSSVLDCVVCMSREARTFLPCGHRCLCSHCTPRVVQLFGKCPLCRLDIGAPSVELC